MFYLRWLGEFILNLTIRKKWFNWCNRSLLQCNMDTYYSNIIRFTIRLRYLIILCKLNFATHFTNLNAILNNVKFSNLSLLEPSDRFERFSK